MTRNDLLDRKSNVRRAVLGTLYLATALGASLAIGVAQAAPPVTRVVSRAANSDYDRARVVEVEPIVRQVRVETPRRECWDEVRTAYRDPPVTQTAVPTLIGAAIGGVLGHQVGSGRGRDVATVAGTVIGASVAHDAATRRAGPRVVEEYTVERCATRYDGRYEERVEGYHVTYEYLGREYTTRMPYDPGDYIRVRVSVAAAE